jgi:hypothetical protein
MRQLGLDLSGRMFHFCSHAGRDSRDRTEPWVEGPYALCGRLPRGNQVYEALRLPQAAGLRDAGLYARAELPTGEVRGAADVPCLWE